MTKIWFYYSNKPWKQVVPLLLQLLKRQQQQQLLVLNLRSLSTTKQFATAVHLLEHITPCIHHFSPTLLLLPSVRHTIIKKLAALIQQFVYVMCFIWTCKDSGLCAQTTRRFQFHLYYMHIPILLHTCYYYHMDYLNHEEKQF